MATQAQKKQWALIGALILPILLIVLVWLSQKIPAQLVPPPQYDFIYSIREHDYFSKYLSVKDDKLIMNYMQRRDKSAQEDPNPKLYLYHVHNQTVSEIAYRVIGDFDTNAKEWQILPVDAPTLKGFIPGIEAPDHYRYERKGRSSGFLSLFGSNYRVTNTIVKDKNVLIFSHDPYRLDFIGWMEPTHD